MHGSGVIISYNIYPISVISGDLEEINGLSIAPAQFTLEGRGAGLRIMHVRQYNRETTPAPQVRNRG